MKSYNLQISGLFGWKLNKQVDLLKQGHQILRLQFNRFCYLEMFEIVSLFCGTNRFSTFTQWTRVEDSFISLEMLSSIQRNILFIYKQLWHCGTCLHIYLSLCCLPCDAQLRVYGNPVCLLTLNLILSTLECSLRFWPTFICSWMQSMVLIYLFTVNGSVCH